MAWERAQALFEATDHLGAAGLLIERCPVGHHAYLMLGRTLERQGRKDEAQPWPRAAEAFSGE